MACSDRITNQDLENAKKDAVTLGEVATSRSGAVSTGAPIDTALNRFGEASDTVNGRLKKMGFAVPVAYAASINFSESDAVKTISRPDDLTPTQSIQYAPFPNLLPFTTSGTWIGDDEGKFFIVQETGISEQDLIDANRVYASLTQVIASNLTVGDVVYVADIGCFLEVLDASFTGNIGLDNGLRARAVRDQVIHVDSVSEMMGQPSGLWQEGIGVNINSYYSGWAATAQGAQGGKNGVIVSDETIINVRGGSADGYGDHFLGNSLNFLNKSDEFINTEYGCRPDQNVYDGENLQAMFNAPRDGQDCTFRFVGGAQFVANGAQLIIQNKGKVTIKSNNSRLRLLNGITTGTMLTITQCRRLTWDSLDIDINAATYGRIVRIDNIQESVKLLDSDVYNFATDPVASNFNVAQQTGFDIDIINVNTVLATGGTSPGLIMNGMNFFNPTIVLDTAFDYNNNNKGGTGVKLGQQAQFWKMNSCGYFGLCIGAWMEGGANGSATNCEFQSILGVVDKALVAASIPEGAAFYVPTQGGNGGKINITASKFTHNWGFSVRSTYTNTERPLHVDNCEFIANSMDAININNLERCTITNNYFNRCHNYLNLPSYPWGSYQGGLRKAINFGQGAKRCVVDGNDFHKIDGFCVSGLLTATDIANKKLTNNTYSSDVTEGFNAFTAIIQRNNELWT